MIFRRTFLAVAFPLTLFALAVLPPSSGRFSKPRELRFQRHDSQLQGAVHRAAGGSAAAIVVVDVESGEILAAKNLEFPGKQLFRPGSGRQPSVMMELLASGKLDPRQRLICRRPPRIGAMRLDGSHTADGIFYLPMFLKDGVSDHRGIESAALPNRNNHGDLRLVCGSIKQKP